MNEKITDIKKLQLQKISKILIIEPDLFDSFDKIIDKCAKIIQKGSILVELNPSKNSDREFLKLAQKLRQLTSIFECLFLIKNRLDIAKFCESDGIVIDFNSAGSKNIIKHLNKDKFFGYSASCKAELNDLNFNYDFIQADIETEQKPQKDKILFNKNNIERLK